MNPHFTSSVLTSLLIFSATAGTAAAQRGGRGGGAAGPPARSAPAPAMNRSAAGAPVRPPVTAAPPASNRLGAGQIVMRPQRQAVIGSPFGGYYDGYYNPYAFGYGYGWGSPYYNASPYPSSYVEQSYVASAPVVQSPSQSEVDLAYQIGQLTSEVARLRQDQAESALRQATAPPPRAAEPPAVPITLVFRDGHRQSIQSYAVVRQTLWVVDERASMKIDIGDLDLVATQQANLGRVLLLPVPGK